MPDPVIGITVLPPLVCQASLGWVLFAPQSGGNNRPALEQTRDYANRLLTNFRSLSDFVVTRIAEGILTGWLCGLLGIDLRLRLRKRPITEVPLAWARSLLYVAAASRP